MFSTVKASNPMNTKIKIILFISSSLVHIVFLTFIFGRHTEESMDISKSTLYLR